MTVSPPRAQVWRNRHFLSLWGGLLVSNLGDWINFIAMYALVYSQTHSPLAVVGLRLVHLLPEVFFGPFAGVFVDRWSRKWTLVVTPVISAAFVSLLLVAHPVPLIYLAEGALTITAMFFDPAVSAAMPNIVDDHELVQANTLSRVTSNLATVAGGLLGGIIVAGIGARAAFGFDAISFLVIAVLISRVRVREERSRITVSSIERELIEGIRYLRGQPVVAAVVVAGGFLVLTTATILTLGIVFSQTVLHAGTGGYGELLAAGGAGSLVAALLTMRRGTGRRDDLIFALSGMAQGAAVLVMGFAHSLLVAALLYAVADAMVTINLVAQVTIIQRMVPDRLRGRIFGVSSSLVHLAALAGALVVAAVTGFLGPPQLISIAGVIALVAGGWTLFAVRRMPAV